MRARELGKWCVPLMSSSILAATALSIAQDTSTNITADLWQAFELGALSVNELDANDGVSGIGAWSLTGTSRFSISSAGEKATPVPVNSMADNGTRGLIYDPAIGGGDARVQWNFNSTSRPAALSFGFWFKAN